MMGAGKPAASLIQTMVGTMCCCITSLASPNTAIEKFSGVSQYGHDGREELTSFCRDLTAYILPVQETKHAGIDERGEPVGAGKYGSLCRQQPRF